MLRKTKIICTIGPASKSSRMIQRLARAGMNVARINTAYGTEEEHTKVIRTIRGVSTRLDVPVAILLDLPGIKLRTGQLRRKEVYLKEGDQFSLTSEKVSGDEQKISVSLPEILNDIKVGNTIFLNEGAIQVKAISTTDSEVRCKVVVGGVLTSNSGINVPGVRLNVPSITGQDLKLLAFGLEQGVDFVAISFVRSAADILRLRQFLYEKGASIPLIAKIEKHEAVNDIDRIIAEADGIMVARGDLGVEIPLKKVPIVQKKIIRKCNQVGKPVIVATQMLESMVGMVRPTRAEVSDVANAIFDGVDAVMLSDETAAGRYPVETARMMANIAVETEKTLPYERMLLEKSEQVVPQTDDAISYGACHIAQQIRAACIVAYTSSGSTALRVSKYRPKTPILAITHNPDVARRLALSWGIEPYVVDRPGNVDAMFQRGAQLALETGIARKGELVVITAGIPTGISGSTNLVKVHRVE
jgi:pyruvate kinase